MINETCMKPASVQRSFAVSRLRRMICASFLLGVMLSTAPSWSQTIYGSPANTGSSKQRPQVESQTSSARAIPDALIVRQKIAQSQLSSRKSAPDSQSTQYSFVEIDIANATFVQPNAINHDGVAVGYYDDANFISHGFVWQQGTVQILDYPGAAQTTFTGINNHGVLVGTYEDANYSTYAFTYSLSDATWTDLPALPGTWMPYFGVGGINDKGEIVGAAGGFIGLLSWKWHPDSQSYSYFTAPAAAEASTLPQAINNRRSIVGSFSVVYGGSLIFLKESGDRYTTISLPSSLSAVGTFGPYGINNSDAIVGTFYTANYAVVSGFIRDRNGTFVVVNQPGADETYLTGINDFGVLVGDTYNPTTGASPGFVAFPLN